MSHDPHPDSSLASHRITIPHTDLATSRLCLGGNRFGTALDQQATFALLDAFVELGGNFVDTAHIYSDWVAGAPRSVSEKTLGEWMRQRQNRHTLVIATKGGHPDLSTPHLPRLGRSEIEKDLDESLRFLGTDTIDLYWLHRDDPTTPVGEILDTLNRQVQAGKIRYAGCSNWSLARIQEAQEHAAQHRMQGFVANQPMWSLAVAQPRPTDPSDLVRFDAPMARFHEQTGMAVVPYSSQAQGYFSKIEQGEETLSDALKGRYATPENRERYRRAAVLGRDRGASAAQVALAYLIAQPFATVPIIGSRTSEQLRESMGAIALALQPDELAYLEGNEA